MRLEITNVRTLKQEEPSVRELEFRKGSVTLGSHSNNLIQLPDVEIAPHHATLVLEGGGQWMYKPTTRHDPATLNGEPITGDIQISDGDLLEITFFSIRFTMDTEIAVELPGTGTTGRLAKIRQYPLPQRSQTRKPGFDAALNPARQQALARFAVALRGCEDVAQLVEQTATALRPLLAARAVWVGVRLVPKGPLQFVFGRSDEGKRVDEPANLETFLYRCLDREQSICIPKAAEEDTQSVLAVPILANERTLGLIHADTRRYVRLFDESDLDFLTVAANLVAAHLDAILHGHVEQRMQRQLAGLSVLREVQAQLYSERVPQWPQLSVATFFTSGAEGSGDLVHVMRLPNGLAAMLVAHVKAETTRSAVILAELRSAFRVAGMHADRPHVQCKAWNWLFFDEMDPCQVNVAVLVINPKTGATEYCTGGAIGVLIIDAEGKPRKLTDTSVPAIGTIRKVDFQPVTERLKDGESLACYTGGCVTASSRDGEVLGERRFVQVLCDAQGQRAPAMLDEVLADLQPFLMHGGVPNDITILLAHRQADAAGSVTT